MKRRMSWRGVENVEVINLDKVASECGTIMKVDLIGNREKVVHVGGKCIRKKGTIPDQMIFLANLDN